MSLKLTFQIALQSDYHVGAGHGLGTEIDSALLRDGDGVLALRGTMLSGLLREGLAELLEQKHMQHWRDEHPCKAGGIARAPNRFCGQYSDQDLSLLDMCPVCRIFGSPRMPKRWSIGSARPQGQAQIGDKPLRPVDVNRHRVKRARVSPRTRRAEPRKLFSQEHGGQQVFEFLAECPADDQATMDDAALLVSAARMVRQLGRGRRRGLGECLITLSEIKSRDGILGGKDPQTCLLKRFRDRWLNSTERLASPDTAALPPIRRERGGQEVRMRIIAHTEEPLLVAQRALAGNQFKGQSAITGKTLRGALAALAASNYDLVGDDATRQAFVDLFLRGGARFPTLYPMKSDHTDRLYPAIPVPRDGFACKVFPGHGIQWGTLSTQDERDGTGPDRTCQAPVSGRQEPCGKAVKAVRGCFVTLSARDHKPFVPARRNELHIRIDRDTGRVKRGQVFEYVALEAGQYFGGELVCKDANAWQVLQEFLGLNPFSDEEKTIVVQLGKGRQRGYGRAMLWFSKANGKPPMWIGQPLQDVPAGGDEPRSRVAAGVHEVTLTLLTDAIIADPWGRSATGFDEDWLTGLFKPGQAQILAGYAATQIVDGFNTIQRLPRWRDGALAAGSSARIRVTGLSDTDLVGELERIEKEGIGLRRNEGYGQVAFNHPVYAGCRNVQDASLTNLELPPDLHPGIAKTDPRAAFRRKWEDNLRSENWRACAGSSALKGAFAAVARWLIAQQSHSPGDLVRVLDVLLADKKDRKTATDALPQALARTLPALGEPDNRLKDEIIEEYGARDKPNQLEQPDGAAKGLELIRRELAYLARKPDWEPFWAEGVAMVAARIADVTKRREEV